jgi:cytochrome c oxidase cbb3-type subunit 4
MDINDLRAGFTVLTFIAFIGVCVWAWSSRRKGSFDSAAQQPFSEDDEKMHQSSLQGDRR